MTRDDALQIKKICEERRIDTLCHFTNAKHLSDILRTGLVPRSQIFRPEHGIKIYYPNDKQRLDGHLDATSLSVSFPNYQMFYSYREEFGADRWCVLLLDISVLWLKGCAFYVKNAADHEVRDLPPTSLHNATAFESMFYEERGGSKRASGLPAKYTTNPQAEVLVFGNVEASHIKRIVFNDTAKLEEAKALPNSAKIQMEMDYSWFTYRSDWGLWKKGY